MGSSSRATPCGPPLSPLGLMRYLRKFPYDIPHKKVDSHVFLTRPPLAASIATAKPLDLHVLGLPPAFTLSQDQTLQLDLTIKCKTQKRSTRQAMLVYFERLISMDYISTSRRPHKIPAHTVKDRLAPLPLPGSLPATFRPSEPHILHPFSCLTTPVL